MKVLLGLLLVFLAVGAMGQVPSTLPFRGDTIKIHKVGGFAELVLQNRTKDTTRGIAVNEGNGHLIFKRPYKIDDTTIVIGLDTFVVGTGSGLTSAQVQTLIDATVNSLPIHMNEDFFTGDGSIGNPWTPDTTVIATHSYTQGLIDSLGAIVDAISPSGVAGGKTTLINVGAGDTLSKYINDSLFHIKSLIAGTNITFTVGANSITINGASGTAEVNTLSATITTTDNRTVPDESILQYILVKPTSTLAAFKVGTVSDDDFFVTSTPVTATGSFVVFDIAAYLSGSTAIYFSGITSSTDIKLIYKPLHE